MSPTTPRTKPADAPPVPDPLTPRSLPADLPGVPAAVHEATHAVHASEARVAELSAALRAKAAEVRVAPDVDRNAAAAAERSGEPLPAATRPALAAEADDLRRLLAAAQSNATRAARAQDAAVAAAREEWHAAALGAVDELLGELDAALAGLDDLHDRLATAGAVVAALDQADSGLLIQWPRPGRSREARARATGKLAQRFSEGRMVPARREELLAAVALLALKARGKLAATAPGPRAAVWAGDDDGGAARARLTAELHMGGSED